MSDSRDLAVQDIDVPRGGGISTLREIRPGNPVAAFVPSNFEEAVRLSRAIAKSRMAPKSYQDDENKILVGMMTGAEVGLTPMQSLRGVAVIGNMPKLWGDVALGVVLASGLVEDMVEDTRGDFDNPNNSDGVAICTIKRKGRPTPVVRRFSVQDARRAGLLTKDTYKGHLERMCQRRARDRAMSDLFADVLSGLYIAGVEEELELEEKGERAGRPVIAQTRVATVDDLHEQARGASDSQIQSDAATDNNRPLATTAAVQADDTHERASEAAKRESDKLIEQEAARAAEAAKPRQRVRRPKRESAPEGSPGPSSSETGGPEAGAEAAATTAVENPPAPPADELARDDPAREAIALERALADEGNETGPTAEAGPSDSGGDEGEEAEFKEVAPPDVIEMRRSYIEIREGFDADMRAAQDKGDHAAAADARSQSEKYRKAILDLEQKYEFPADDEQPSERPDTSIYTDNGYDLNAGDPPKQATKLEDAIAELKKKEMVVDAAAYEPEGLSDADMMTFDSVKAKHVAGLIEEAKHRRR